MSSRTWHVTAMVIFPNHIEFDADDQGRPMVGTQLRPRSRIPTMHRRLDGAEIFIYEGAREAVPQIRDDLRFAVATIAVRMNSKADEPFAATEDAMPIFDRILESFAFQMQTSLGVEGVRAIDLSGSPVTGEEREFGTWTGLALPTFRPTSVPMQSLVGRLVPDPNLDLAGNDPRASRALDWYLKALMAPFEADHFIFLWIACEIIAADSDLTVTEPYRGPLCGHLIETCPLCGKETTKPVQGQSMKRWLIEGFGVDEDIARRVWKARQMLHGAFAFESAVMAELPELSQWLRAVVVNALKPRLGLPAEDPPFALPLGLAVSPYMGVSGTAAVAEEDLRPPV